MWVISGRDPDDPATSAPHMRPIEVEHLVSPNLESLRGKGLGVWRSPAGDEEHLHDVLDRSVTALRSAGATVADDVTLSGMALVEEAMFPAMLVEFVRDINVYLSDTPGRHPNDLAGLIAYNEEHADLEMPHFGQDIRTGSEDQR